MTRSFSLIALASALTLGCEAEGPALPESPENPETAPWVQPTAQNPGTLMPSECAQVQVKVEQVIPTVTLLIDKSGSMTANFNGVERWTAVYRTLMEPTTGLVAKLESSVRFGLALYTSNGGNAGGQCPMLDEVAPALGNHGAIDAVFSPARPTRDTPTGASITAAAMGLLQVTEPGPKVIILATDGAPDTCTDPNPSGTTRRVQADAETVAAARAAHDDHGIETFVISVGNQVTAAHLQDMANVGVGLPAGGATNAPYYQALDTAQLELAFDGIVRGVRTCEYTLDGAIDPALAPDATVTLDGTTLVHATDWHLKDNATLELKGAACDTILDGGTHEVTASFPCAAIIL